MQIKIVASTPNWAPRDVLAAISHALTQGDCEMLLRAMPVGDPFTMADDRKGLKIEITRTQ